MNTVFLVIEKINRYGAQVGIVALLIMMTVIVVNVLGRALFNTPVFGTIEVVELTGVILVSFIVGYTQLMRGNIAVTVMVDRMSTRLRGVFDSFTLLIGLSITAVLVWSAFFHGWDMAIQSETTTVFQIVRAPFRFVWAFGCITLFLVLAAQSIHSLAKVVK